MKLLTAVSLIYIALLAVMPEKGLMSIQNSLYYVVKMLQIIPVIFILTALIEAWAPRELIPVQTTVLLYALTPMAAAQSAASPLDTQRGVWFFQIQGGMRKGTGVLNQNSF